MARGNQILTALQIGRAAVDFGRDVLGNRQRQRIAVPSPPDFSQSYQDLRHLTMAAIPQQQPSPQAAPSPEHTEPLAVTDYAGTSQLSAAGKACIPCGNDHFSVVSGGLAEAIRFAREGGIEHPEVIERIADAEMELNTFERWDGAPERVARLSPEEKPLMDDMLTASRKLRHLISDITDIDNLEQSAVQARDMRKEFKTRTFRMQLGKEMRQRAREGDESGE